MKRAKGVMEIWTIPVSTGNRSSTSVTNMRSIIYRRVSDIGQKAPALRNLALILAAVACTGFFVSMTWAKAKAPCIFGLKRLISSCSLTLL